MKKKFTIGTILSITHGNLLTPDIGNVYEILNFMCHDNLMTHALPRAAEFAKPFILSQYPQLSEWDGIKEHINPENWKQYLDKAIEMFGESLWIEATPEGVFTHKDPVQELTDMGISAEKIITIEHNAPIQN